MASTSAPRQPGTRAAIYCRVSSKVQATSDKESLPAQQRNCEQFALAFAPPLTVEKVYLEPGYTATKYDRPAMSQLLRDALAGQFEHLIIDRTDRLTRGGTGQYGRFVDQLKEAGVRLHFEL